MTKPQITVRLSPSLLASLDHYVERSGTSKTDVVVSAVSRASAFGSAKYIGCADNVPLNQRVAELEAQMKELTALVKSGSGLKEIEE